MQESFFDILMKAHPLNEFSIIFIGVILVIFVQNTVFYFNHKDKSYFWYALYALIILIDQSLINYNLDTYFFDVKGTSSLSSAIHVSLEWLYNSIYLFFVLSFAGKALFIGNGSQIIRRIISFLFIILLILFIIDIQYTHSIYVKVLHLLPFRYFLYLVLLSFGRCFI